MNAVMQDKRQWAQSMGVARAFRAPEMPVPPPCSVPRQKASRPFHPEGRCIRAILICAFWFAGIATAEIIPLSGAGDSRIRTADYKPDEVYRLTAHVGFEIELILEEGEVFTGHAGGDLEAISIAAHDQHVVIKPKAPVVHTNLLLFTDRREYRLDYSATARRPDPAAKDLVYAVRFIYPPRVLPEGPSAGERLEADMKSSSGRPLNLDYGYCGHPSLQPISASDDGVRTRLRFAARKEWPAVFVRNDDDSESLLNFSVLDGEMIIHRVARQLVLRRGRLTGCVVNRGFNGTGARLESGTIAPEVERHTKDSP